MKLAPKIREDLGFLLILFKAYLEGTFVVWKYMKTIRRMKEKSERGEVFSFAFMSYSYERNKSQGIVKVEHARLRKQNFKIKSLC